MHAPYLAIFNIFIHFLEDFSPNPSRITLLASPERLVLADEGGIFGREPREDGRVHGAAVRVDDGEGGAGVLGHGHAGAGEDAVRGAVGDADAEGEAVADADSLHLVAAAVQDADPGVWRR